MKTSIKGITLVKNEAYDLRVTDLPDDLKHLAEQHRHKKLKDTAFRVEVLGKRKTATNWKEAQKLLREMTPALHKPQHLRDKLEKRKELMIQTDLESKELLKELRELEHRYLALTDKYELVIQLNKTAPILNEQQAYQAVIQILNDEGKLYSEEVKEMLVILRYHLNIRESQSTYKEVITDGR